MAVEIKVEYLGKTSSRATHGPSGKTLDTTAPKDNGGDGSTFSPTDLFATSLGTCVITIMAMAAERRGLDLRGATVTVEKHMSVDPPRRIARLPVRVKLPIRVSPEDQRLLEAAGHGCPVHRSIHPDIDSPIILEFPAE
jgi:putative redox protein